MNAAQAQAEPQTRNEMDGGWFIVRSGIRFYPLAPKSSDVLIEDIAFALSNICRFGGHIPFYSVCEHSCHVCDILPNPLKLQGLMHDATEAYVGDMVRPLKKQMPDYEAAEWRVWLSIASKFNLPMNLDPLVKEADNRVLLAERDKLMPRGPNTHNWFLDQQGFRAADVMIKRWNPDEARWQFMRRFADLTGTQI